MAKLGHGRKSRRLWWFAGVIAAVAIVASFGTPKAGCAGSPDDEPDPPAGDPACDRAKLEATRDAVRAVEGNARTDAASNDAAHAVPVACDAAGGSSAALEGLEQLPAPQDDGTPNELAAIAPATFCLTTGEVAPVGAHGLKVDTAVMRGVVADDKSRTAELAFIFRGASKNAVPLASGEIRMQIGLKLRAQNSCNIVYVMWHIQPTSGIFILVKSNPGMATHAECADRGYINLPPTAGVAAPMIAVDEPHVLRAEIEGESLRIHADGREVWSGTLPEQAFAFDGPAGVRSDNGEFDFELRIPGGGQRNAKCIPGSEH